MICEIDQSGKVEDTRKLTVVCFANGKVRTFLITAKEKRKALIAMRALDKPHKNFVFRIFTGLIFILLKGEKIGSLVIDREYPGHETFIRDTLVALFKKNKMELPEVSFGQIGKASNAHKEALAVFQGKRKADVVVKATDILGIFVVGKRKPRL